LAVKEITKDPCYRYKNYIEPYSRIFIDFEETVGLFLHISKGFKMTNKRKTYLFTLPLWDYLHNNLIKLIILLSFSL
jgi:hypothetical protein